MVWDLKSAGELYTCVKRGNWKEVIKMYGEDKKFQITKLSEQGGGGGTALHVAVYAGRVEVVKKLVSLICNTQTKLPLTIQNDKGNTPLHVAAEIGNLAICQILASVDHLFVDEKNFNGETPLFMAALYDLALQLINMHEEAAQWMDGQQWTALHVLATKPTAFKSGAHMGICQHFLYNCIRVEELKTGDNMSNKSASFPENCSILTTLKRVLLFKKIKEEVKDEKDTDLENNNESQSPTQFKKSDERSWSWNILYGYWMVFIQIIMLPILMFLEFGFDEIKKLRKEKQKHTWVVQLMKKLIELGTPPVSMSEIPPAPYWTQDGTKYYPPEEYTRIKVSEHHSNMTPMLLAAMHGVVEMVSRLFKDSQQSIRDSNSEGENVVHLAAQFRQAEVYKFLMKNKKTLATLIRASDKQGNTALHRAAYAGLGHTMNPWHVTGPALQLQSEIKWYRFVEDSMENNLFVQYNEHDKFAETVFKESHKDLLNSGREWLVKTSESCSLLAALITTVVFASATTVPGGNGDNGTPPLESETGFFIFAISSLIALCLSTTSVVAFLSILSSKFEIEDFAWKLPVRLLIGLSSLFFSIVAMLASFCAGHYFMLRHHNQNMVVVAYVAASLPIALFFAIAQLHLYYDLLHGILSKVPT